ncbi:YhdH/YhfP family quinone oxidoreductase [Enterobacter cloacae]|uniref:YhdH/YhfP family quinone oxidoreductase n=1 Tax=Enterobacter cloacae TaxID=550 RepID=UPI0034D710D4
MNSTYKAFVVKEADGNFISEVQVLNASQLPAGSITIKVAYSSLNYKDALSASGAKFITQNYPHVTGIDAAGVVVASSDKHFNPGDEVIVTGFDLGMNSDGGHAEYIQIPSEWAIPLPEGLTLKQAMIIGTAGFTAGLSVWQLIKKGVVPADGPVIVSGASGGVGSIAVKILAKLGYEVHAVSMTTQHANYLNNLGAKKVFLVDDFQNAEVKGVHLLEPEYSAVVDSVGGQVFSTLIKKLKYGGIATTCGLVNGIELDLTIFAFINRGIQVNGIDSVWIPMEERLPVWQHLATDWKVDLNEEMFTEISLNDLDTYMKRILNGQMKGRAIVSLNS